LFGVDPAVSFGAELPSQSNFGGKLWLIVIVCCQFTIGGADPLFYGLLLIVTVPYN
jgi:hypothetical protein